MLADLTFSSVSRSKPLWPSEGSSLPVASGPVDGLGATRARGGLEDGPALRASDGSSMDTPQEDRG